MFVRRLMNSLAFRGLVIFCSCAAVILGFITVMNARRHRDIIADIARKNVEQVSQLIVTAMRYPMLRGDQDVIQMQFDQYVGLPNIIVAHMVDKNGIIRRSTDHSLIGQVPNIPHLKKALSGEKHIGLEMHKRSGQQMSSELIPIFNEQKCYACHGSSDKVLGVVRIGLDWEGVRANIRQSARINNGFAVLGILVLSALIAAFFLKLVVFPIKNLEQGMRAVSSGRLDVRVKAHKYHDEIGGLTDIFNKMAADLSGLMAKEQERSGELERLNNNLQSEIDIRRKVEDALGQSKRMTEDIINFLPDATLAIDKEGKVIAWNKALENMTGVKAEEMLGKGDHAYAVPFYGQARPILIDMVLEDGVAGTRDLYEMLDRDEGGVLVGEGFVPKFYNGKGAFARGLATVLYDAQGRVVGAIESIRDITKKRQAEQALLESRQELASIIDFLPDPTFAIDLEGRIIAWNRAMEQLSGIKAPDVMGKGDYEYAVTFYGRRQPILVDLLLHPDMDAPSYYTVARRENGKMTGEVFTPALNAGKGATLWAAASLLRDREGKVVGAIETVRDITEIRQTQQQLSQAYEKLKHVQSQLIQASKMATVGTLAGGVAHEINNPLTGVLNNVQLISVLAAEKSDFKMEDFRSLLQVVEESAQRCIKITRSLLDFSRASRGEAVQLQVNDLVEKVTAFIHQELILENIRLEKKLDPGAGAVMGDGQLLQQVIFDVIANARWAVRKKHHERGGWIGIETAQDAGKNSVRLSIRDNGVGIAPEHLEKIFEPFFTTKEVGTGTGLGLSIVYNIIKEHGGAIEARSFQGEGMEFVITLPAVEMRTAGGFPGEVADERS